MLNKVLYCEFSSSLIMTVTGCLFDKIFILTESSEVKLATLCFFKGIIFSCSVHSAVHLSDKFFYTIFRIES